MKFMNLALVCLLSSVAVAAQASPRSIEVLQPTEVDILPTRVFTPMGFDDNDNTQIVLDGELSSTCFKLGKTLVRVDHDSRKVFVRQQAFYYNGGWCAEVRIPYVQTVNLGILNAGQYDIMIEDGSGASKSFATLPVSVATSSNPDDFLYAPVTDAHMERGNGVFDGSGKPATTLVLNGYFPSTCMTFKTAKVLVRSNNVIEVLPIVDLDHNSGCAQVTTEFNISVSLKDVARGRYLVHIRSLNGQSINRIVDL